MCPIESASRHSCTLRFGPEETSYRIGRAAPIVSDGWANLLFTEDIGDEELIVSLMLFQIDD